MTKKSSTDLARRELTAVLDKLKSATLDLSHAARTQQEIEGVTGIRRMALAASSDAYGGFPAVADFAPTSQQYATATVRP